MRLRVDLSAITHNATKLSALADKAGLELNAVLKNAFVTPPIFCAIARGGITRLCLTSEMEASTLDYRHRPQLLGLALPRSCLAVFKAFSSSLHVSEATLDAMSTAAEAAPQVTHAVWIAVRSSDDREGFDPVEVIRSIERWRRPMPQNLFLGGLLSTWGCMTAKPPPITELRAFFNLAEEAGALIDAGRLPVSIGGSALLPMLHELGPPPQTHLRVGEGLLTGTIPGCTGDALGLRPAFTLCTEVCEVRERTRVLINVGVTTCDPRDLSLEGRSGSIGRASSDVTSLVLGTPAAVGDEIALRLGFSSANRAMSRKDMEVEYVEMATCRVGLGRPAQAAAK